MHAYEILISIRKKKEKNDDAAFEYRISITFAPCFIHSTRYTSKCIQFVPTPSEEYQIESCTNSKNLSSMINKYIHEQLKSLAFRFNNISIPRRGRPFYSSNKAFPNKTVTVTVNIIPRVCWGIYWIKRLLRLMAASTYNVAVKRKLISRIK